MCDKISAPTLFHPVIKLHMRLEQLILLTLLRGHFSAQLPWTGSEILLLQLLYGLFQLKIVALNCTAIGADQNSQPSWDSSSDSSSVLPAALLLRVVLDLAPFLAHLQLRLHSRRPPLRRLRRWRTLLTSFSIYKLCNQCTNRRIWISKLNKRTIVSRRRRSSSFRPPSDLHCLCFRKSPHNSNRQRPSTNPKIVF